jgi:hypothetical protein
MYKNNSRDSSKINGCSPLQLYCKLKDLSSAIGYYSYTYRYLQAEKRMTKQIIIFFLLTVSHFSFGQKTILWKITDTINNKSSTIVGTFHQLGNSFVDSIPEIKERLLKSEIAIFESIGKIEETQKMINTRKKSLEIENNFKKKDFDALIEISKNWKVDIYKLKPIELRWKLQREFQKTKCKTVIPSDNWDHFDIIYDF